MFGSDEEVASFITAFESCRLPKSSWTHHAHLVVGFWYLSRHSFKTALDEVRDRIKHHNESVGTTNTDTSGYHETITRLYMAAIDAHIKAHPTLAFSESLKALLASPLANSSWPLSYYSRARLFSVEARRRWVEPDLAPLA